jgi:hypothetical protein
MRTLSKDGKKVCCSFGCLAKGDKLGRHWTGKSVGINMRERKRERRERERERREKEREREERARSRGLYMYNYIPHTDIHT